MTVRRGLIVAAYWAGGVLVLSCLSAVQKLYLGVAPFAAKGYVAPVLFGSIAGLLCGWLTTGSENLENRTRARYDELFAIFEGIAGEMYVADMETHTILYASRHMQQLYGDVVGRRCWESIHEGMTGPCPFCTNSRLLNAAGLPTDPVVWEQENDRTGRWYQCVNRAIPWPDGRFVRMEIAFDITEHKRTEEALRENEEKYRELVQSANSIIMRTDADGNITFFNEFAEEFFGYSLEEIIGRNALGTILPKTDSEGHDLSALMRQIVERPEEFVSNENENMRKSGERVRVAWTSKAIRGEDGTVIGLLFVGTDVTALRQAEAQARLHREQLMQADKMVALGTRVSGIGHEINNPNNLVILNVPVLKGAWENALPVLDQHYQNHGDFRLRGIPFAQARSMLPQLFDDILEGAQRIKRIVDELKDYARPQEGRPKEQVDVNVAVQSAITLLHTFIYKRARDFSVEHADDLPQIQGSAQRIEQVIINLLQNACEALEDNTKGVSVKTSRDEQEEGVVITVVDEGTGIPEEDLRHLTDPFFTTKRDIGGTGLGLSIAARIVREHNGTLSFKRRPGGGTIATVFLPLPPAGKEEGIQ